MLCGKMLCGRMRRTIRAAKAQCKLFSAVKKDVKKMEQKSRLPGKPGQAAFLVRRNSIQWMSSFKPRRK